MTTMAHRAEAPHADQHVIEKGRRFGKVLFRIREAGWQWPTLDKTISPLSKTASAGNGTRS
jgi:hypothetical protein